MSVPQVIDWQEFDRLIDGACDWTLSADDWAKLSQRLGESSEACDYYLACMDIHGTLAWQMMPNARLSPAELRQYNQAEIDLLAEADCLADAFLPVSSVSPSSFFGNTIHNAYYGTISFFSQELPFSLFIATVLTGLGLWIASLVYISSPERIAQNSSSRTPSSGNPTLEVVGKITSMVDCQWSRDGREPSGYDNVLMGRQFKLDSGLMEITYNTGAKVILQGPAAYKVESRDGGFLSVGKLTARLEKKEEHVASSNPQSPIPPSPLAPRSSPLFTVRTPTAMVTDLGTEFGVEVDKQGVTTSHVFRGAVSLQAVAVEGNTEGVAQVLHENQSARVGKDSGKQGSGNRITVFTTPAKPLGFVREIPKLTMKTLDLVDVVAGGNGFSGRRNAGIDPKTGRTTNTLPPLDKVHIVGDHQYHRVKELPFVDGIFIPDGQDGRVQIDSAGHVYTNFPATDNWTASYIWTGASSILTDLDGIDYASPPHGALVMHANKGITFDLAAIRKANPGWKLTRFRSMAGNTEKGNLVNFPSYADLWVLVDGKAVFRRRAVTRSHGAYNIGIPLDEKVCFLTLVATDGGNGFDWDWIIFGDPRLELVSPEADAVQKAIGQ